jgi:CubicO group peptidase (beta-lactamase class C family)
MRWLGWLAALAFITACSEDKKAPPAGEPSADAGPATPKYDFSDAHAFLFAGSWKTDGVVVLLDGELVWEEYANGYTAEKRHITYSVSKSVGSALLGIAIADKLVALDDSVCKFITPPANADATLCDTTIRNVVHMSSGLQWVEDYGDDPNKSDVLPMLYGNWSDMGVYVAGKPRANKAGSTWSYSSGDANLLARTLRGALAGKDMRAWAKEKLFDPAGLSNTIFEVDRSGTLVFSSSWYATPRDMARFGQLFLGGGAIDGKQIIPQDWITFSATAAPAAATPTPRIAAADRGDTGGSYGASWWLNAASPTAPADTVRFPNVPIDMYSADGHWGQRIVVIPSRKVVIARVGNDRDKTFDDGTMSEKVLAAIGGGS